MNTNEIPPAKTVLRLLLIMLPALALVPFTYFPPLNPFETPHIDLTGPVALAAYWITETGGHPGIPYVGVLMTILVVCRSRISWKERLIEALVIIVAWGGVLGILAYSNEHFVKRSFAVPRPFIRGLASTPTDRPALGKTAEEFYAIPDKAQRSDYLRTILTPEFGSTSDFKMDDRIRTHWIKETGYSFPSGHAFAAMMTATFFLGLGLSCFQGPRRLPFYVLVLWAVAVCYSRPILRVHSPTDVTVGGLEGILVGTLAFLVVRRVLVRLRGS